MEWFEQLTGFSPDGANGTFEATLATVIGLAIVVVAFSVVSRRRTKNAR